MGWSGLIGDWTTFTLALLIMAQDPTLLQILPPLLVILALCLLPWRGGASLGMNKAQRASLLAAPAAGGIFGAVPATSSMLGARPMAPQLIAAPPMQLPGLPGVVAPLPSLAVRATPR